MRFHVVLAFLVLAGRPASGLTPAEIDAAAARVTNGQRTIVRRLASERFAGRDNDTPQSTLAQTYLIRRLERLGPGLDAAQVGEAAYRQPFVQSGQTGTNLLAIIPGSELPDEYVIVGAHYDHLDSRSVPEGGCFARGTPGGAVCNGATDNAAGVAAVLAIGKAIRRLPTPPRRSIVLALWDAEEDGLLGSLYYVNNPVVPLAATVGYVNFDIQGANLLPSLHGTSFAVSSETGGVAFQDMVDAAIASETLGTRLLSYIFGQLRSDYANFVAHHVPTVFFSDATGGCYHTTGDDFRLVDFTKLGAQSRLAFRLTVALAETATPPVFSPPSPRLATYEDAVVLSQVIDTGLADLALFSPPDQTMIQDLATQLDGIVSDGPALFTNADVGTLLSAAANTLEALGRLGCRRM
jgi:hypothetical protein